MYDELIIALQVCVDEKKGCIECPYQAKCLNTAGKHAAIADAADALEKLNKRINFLMSCIYEAEDALNRGTDNEWARVALEKAEKEE